MRVGRTVMLVRALIEVLVAHGEGVAVHLRPRTRRVERGSEEILAHAPAECAIDPYKVGVLGEVSFLHAQRIAIIAPMLKTGIADKSPCFGIDFDHFEAEFRLALLRDAVLNQRDAAALPGDDERVVQAAAGVGIVGHQRLQRTRNPCARRDVNERAAMPQRRVERRELVEVGARGATLHPITADQVAVGVQRAVQVVKDYAAANILRAHRLVRIRVVTMDERTGDQILRGHIVMPARRKIVRRNRGSFCHRHAQRIQRETTQRCAPPGFFFLMRERHLLRQRPGGAPRGAHPVGFGIQVGQRLNVARAHSRKIWGCLCGAHPTEPSICRSISRFNSTAYSIGNSFTNGSKKPLTIIAAALFSGSPRLIR